MRKATKLKGMQLTNNRERRGMSSFNSDVNITYTGTERCPYCGKQMHRVKGKDVGLDKYANDPYYACNDYPKCDSYGRLRISDSKILVISTPANVKLRGLRKEAHHYLSLILDNGIAKNSTEAHRLLSDRMLIGNNQLLHIGELREYGCEQIIDAAIEILYFNRNKIKTYTSWRSINRKVSDDQLRKLKEIESIASEAKCN